MGSSGDVHPFVALGTELKSRGHKVTFLVNGYFRTVVERAGLSFEEMGTAEEFKAELDNPDLWHPTRSLAMVAKLSTRGLGPTVEFIKKFNVPGQTVVVAGTLALGARIAEEKWGIPTAMVHLQPAILRSIFAPPRLPGLPIPSWFPAPFIRSFYRLVDWAADRAYQPLNDYRKTLHMPPVKGILGDWVHSKRLTIGLFPDWFAPRQKDWPRSIKLTGFPLYDGTGVEETSAEVEEFLKAGSKPIVFTAGSAMKIDRLFFEESDRAVRLLGCRAMYITRFPEQLPSSISVTARHFSYVPFSQLFSRALVSVNHGGVGTVAQALRSGRPQLVVPRAHDQFDNGARVERLGAGRVLPYPRYKRGTVAKILKKILDDKKMEATCAQVAGYFEPGVLKQTAELIESLNKN